MVKLFPFYGASFETSFAPGEAIQRLHGEIGTDKWWVIIGPWNAYVGSNPDRRMFLGRKLRDGGVFCNNLNTEPGELRQYNAFQAVVRARIISTGLGSTVRASFRMSAFVLVFLAVWCAAFAWFTLMIASGIALGEASLWSVLVGPAFIVAAWLFVCFAFSRDAAAAERMLKVTLERA